MRLVNSLAVCGFVLLLQGCQSYTIVQRNVFADDYGNILTVNYGRSDTDHVSTFISPATGQEVEFVSRLMVRVDLPDGDSVKAWQCMNFLPHGTMYETDNGEWKLLANGFSTIVYHRTDETPPRYLEVYRGVLCETPGAVTAKKDERWRDVTSANGREYRKSAPRAK